MKTEPRSSRGGWLWTLFLAFALSGIPWGNYVPGLSAGSESPATAVQTPNRFGPPISFLVQHVSRENLWFHIQRLQNFKTRFGSTANCEAAGTYLYNLFSLFGLQVEFEPFVDRREGYASRNIVATIPGKISPEMILVVCAHYDSLSYSTYVTDAPGADDNGSGCAALLEIGRLLAGREFDFTVRLVAFSAEETGHSGSQQHVESALLRGERILGALNMDMIAYSDQEPEDIDLVVNSNSDWLADFYSRQAVRHASLPVNKILDPSFTSSDHASFWEKGLSAVLMIEDVPPNNPHYHTPNDTVDALNFAFLEGVTKATLAVAVELAQPVSDPQAPTGLTARSQISRSVFFARKTVALTWRAGMEGIAGYNVYRATVRHGSYEKINASPVAQPNYIDRYLPISTTYYYVVTAVNHQLRESNFSWEVREGR